MVPGSIASSRLCYLLGDSFLDSVRKVLHCVVILLGCFDVCYSMTGFSCRIYMVVFCEEI